MAAYPKADKHLTVALSVKELNDTLDPDVFDPFTIVFGEYPPVLTRSEDPISRPNLDERAKRWKTHGRDEGLSCAPSFGPTGGRCIFPFERLSICMA